MNNSKNKFVTFLKAFLWNSGGISFYLICKWTISIFVVRFSNGYYDAGYLALAMNVTNIFYGVTAYSMRNYQVSDTKGEFSDSIYVTSRLLTVILALLLCFIYCFIFIGVNYQSVIILFYMLLVSGEGFADVIHGIDQKHWRMELVGLSFVFRGIAVLIAFIGLYSFFGLAVAIIGSSLFSLSIIIFFDIRLMRKISQFRLEFNKPAINRLLKICFPLMLMGVLFIMTASVSRIVLEKVTNTEILGLYTSAILPSVVVIQAAAFVFTPLVNVFTICLADRNYKKFRQMFFYTCGCIGLIIVICVIGAYFFGAYILELIFGEGIKPYSYLLVEAIVVAGLNALGVFLISILTIIRKLNVILPSCALGFLICLISSRLMILKYGISGANYAQIAGFSVSSLIMLISYVFYSIEKKKSNNNFKLL
jgi:O-antigen/teichoic acid export membrane protein